jgi:hypothetical protein
MADKNASAPRATSNRSTVPVSDTFRQYISGEWSERTEVEPRPREQGDWAAARRARLSALYADKRLIIPAGSARVRSNDTDYAYRAHSAFSHLTGWASDSVAGSVLVLEPSAEGHTATLYFRKPDETLTSSTRTRKSANSGPVRARPSHTSPVTSDFSPPTWRNSIVCSTRSTAARSSSATLIAISRTRSTGDDCSPPMPRTSRSTPTPNSPATSPSFAW